MGKSKLPSLSSLRIDIFQIGLPGGLSAQYSSEQIGLFILTIRNNKFVVTVYFGDMPTWRATRIEDNDDSALTALLEILHKHDYIDPVLV